MEKIKQHIGIGEKYLKDMVYGSIDGIITTFAVVSGVIGASLSHGIIVVLGLANLFADGISMAIGNYLSTKSELERISKSRKLHKKNIDQHPEKEKKELKSAFEKTGLESSRAQTLVSEITQDKSVWENFLVRSQYGSYSESAEPKKTAFATFASFVVAGFVPLLAFVLSSTSGLFDQNTFVIASVLTGIALFSVGSLKASIIEKSRLRSGLETLLIGGVAAAVAFGVGYLLQGFAG